MEIIGFDAQPLFRFRDGIGTYTLEIIKSMARSRPDIVFEGLYFKEFDGSDLIKEFDTIKNVRFKKVSLNWQIIRFFAEIGIWIPVDKFMKINYLGFIYTNFTCLPWISAKTPKCLVVHDAAFLHFPETLSGANLYYLKKFVKKSVSRKNTRVFTISKFIAQDLRKIYGKKFSIAYPSSTIKIAGLSRKEKTNSDKKNLLFIGTLEPRKNISRLVEAYAQLSENIRADFPLQIVGKKGWVDCDPLIEKIINVGGSYLGQVTDVELRKLLIESYGVLLPSLYEGFGIPVLDASRFKKPVLISRYGPMVEIVGEKGAIFVDPLDTKSIYKGLIKLTTMSDDIKRMTERSFMESNKFSWDSSAKALLETFFKK